MLLVALAAALGPTRLPPVDQCARDRSFVEFRTGLRRIIARRDGQALLAALAEDAQASFAADVGKKGFIQVWGLDSAKSSKIWKELCDALSLGCVLTSGQASVPGFESRIGAERDAFET